MTEPETDRVSEGYAYAQLATETDDGRYHVRGVIIGENDRTTGMSGKETVWTRDILKEAVEQGAFDGAKLIRGIRGEGHLEMTDQASPDDIVGRITDVSYRDGEGVVYQGFVVEEGLADRIEHGLLDVSADIYRELGDYDDELGAYRVKRVLAAPRVTILDMGASKSASIESGGAEALSYEALGESFDGDVPDDADLEQLAVSIHDPEYTGTREGGSWDRPAMSDFDTDDLSDIDDHFVASETGFPPENYGDLLLPVVDPSGDLALPAIRAAQSRLPQTEGLSADEENRIGGILVRLANDEFDAGWEQNADGDITAPDSSPRRITVNGREVILSAEDGEEISDEEAARVAEAMNAVADGGEPGGDADGDDADTSDADADPEADPDSDADGGGDGDGDTDPNSDEEDTDGDGTDGDDGGDDDPTARASTDDGDGTDGETDVDSDTDTDTDSDADADTDADADADDAEADSTAPDSTSNTDEETDPADADADADAQDDTDTTMGEDTTTEELEAKLDEATERIEALESDLDETNQEKEALSDEVDDLESDLEDAEETAADLREQNQRAGAIISGPLTANSPLTPERLAEKYDVDEIIEMWQEQKEEAEALADEEDDTDRAVAFVRDQLANPRGGDPDEETQPAETRGDEPDEDALKKANEIARDALGGADIVKMNNERLSPAEYVEQEYGTDATEHATVDGLRSAMRETPTEEVN